MIPSNMNYRDWERVYVKKEISLDDWKRESENPKFETKTWEQAGKVRTRVEFEALGRDDKVLVEKYVGIPSKWSGNIQVNKENRCGKEWNCDISLHEDAPEHVLIHELIHSCSASYSDKNTFWMNVTVEELPVHMMSQEIAALKGIDVVESAYDEGVELLRKYKKQLGLPLTDLKFAKKILSQPIPDRWDWLESLIDDLDLTNITIEKYSEISNLMEGIREWQPKKN